MEENKHPIETTVEESEAKTMPESISESVELIVDGNAEQPAADEVRQDVPPVDCPHSTNGLVLGLAIGMVVGAVVGFLIDYIPISIVSGILLGGAVGCLLDLRVDRRRKEEAERKEE